MQAQRDYRQNFYVRHFPSRNCVINLVRKFAEISSVFFNLIGALVSQRTVGTYETV